MSNNFVLKTPCGQYLTFTDQSKWGLVKTISGAIIFENDAVDETEIKEFESELKRNLTRRSVIVMEEDNFNEMMRIRTGGA